MKQFFLTAIALAMSLTALAFQTDTITVSGPGLAAPMRATVILPDAKASVSEYNTVYILHGYDGDHTSWVRRVPHLGELADEYQNILVLPGVGDTWYFDSTVNPEQQVETFFTETLVPYIDSHYPTINDRHHRAITGLSMGGHGAFWLASRHPDLFGAVGSMSGGVDIRPFTGRWKIEEAIGAPDSLPQGWTPYTVAGNIDRIKDADLAITFDCGVNDFFAEVNDNLHRSLVQAGVPHDYTSRPGTHSWSYWGNSILYHMLFFNRYFNSAQ